VSGAQPSAAAVASAQMSPAISKPVPGATGATAVGTADHLGMTRSVSPRQCGRITRTSVTAGQHVPYGSR
jgi:hypothetical protein